MPQFQIRRHPHGGTFQIFFVNLRTPTRAWFEGNSIQECLDFIIEYLDLNTHKMNYLFHLEVFSD